MRTLYSDIILPQISHLLVSSIGELICAYKLGGERKPSDIRSVKKKEAVSTMLLVNILSCCPNAERYKLAAANFFRGKKIQASMKIKIMNTVWTETLS